ncbi:MAG TPA: SRPBCC family protein [Mycobacterium sp.]|nr:SRPBCC family protein [Mycobacterium sp.]
MRQELEHDEVSLVIRATPATLYDLVTDITRTAEFSPNVLRSQWIGGATAPAVGARFKASSAPRRGFAPSNKAVIASADRGRQFAFNRTVPFAGTVEWRYQFSPESDGTRVIESYTVIKPITALGWFIIGIVFGEKDRKTALRADMQETLLRIKAAIESPGSSAAAT